MPKIISTIIEDEVTFLTDLDVEYVSLVRHGANRTPFRILKSDKGGSTMKKVVTAVLIPKSISDDDATGYLEGYRSDEMKEYDTYKSFIQVDHEAIDPDSAEVIFLDKEAGVMGIIATLVADKDEGGETQDPKNPDAAKEDEVDKGDAGEPKDKGEVDLKTVEKDALDYATMDELYMELWAMADIVGGALRQSQIKSSTRKTTVLTAIDNFRTFASMVLDNAKSADVVKSEDHPDLSHHVLVVEKAEPEGTEKAGEEQVIKKAACVCPDCGITVEAVDCAAAECPECKTQLVPKEEKVDEPKEEPKEAAFDEATFMGKVMEKVNELLTGKASTEDIETKVKEVTDSITESAKKTQEVLEDLSKKLDALKDLSAKVNGLSENVEKLENTPRTPQTDTDDDPLDVSKKGAGSFTGTIFSNFRNQE